MPPESIALALIPLLPLLGALANGILALGYAHRRCACLTHILYSNFRSGIRTMEVRSRNAHVASDS